MLPRDVVSTSSLQGFHIFSSGDLIWTWLPPNTMYTPPFRNVTDDQISIHHSYLKMSCVQLFRILTFGNLKGPLTSTKNKSNILIQQISVPSLKSIYDCHLLISFYTSNLRTKGPHTQIHTNTQTYILWHSCTPVRYACLRVIEHISFTFRKESKSPH